MVNYSHRLFFCMIKLHVENFNAQENRYYQCFISHKFTVIRRSKILMNCYDLPVSSALWQVVSIKNGFNNSINGINVFKNN